MHYQIIGIEDSDGQHCECCGASCPKRRIVLKDDNGTVTKLGSSCASMAILGNKKTKSVSSIVVFSKAACLARKWLSEGYLPRDVCKGIWMRFGLQCQPSQNSILLVGVGIVNRE